MFLIFLGAPPLLRIQIFLAFNAELGWLDNVSGLFLSIITIQMWSIIKSMIKVDLLAASAY
jgi:hypothetical protein